MRLKQYLRGLGIGIIVTVLVIGVGRDKTKAFTDEQVKARAAELGMVEESLLSKDIPNVTTEETTETGN